MFRSVRVNLSFIRLILGSLLLKKGSQGNLHNVEISKLETDISRCQKKLAELAANNETIQIAKGGAPGRGLEGGGQGSESSGGISEEILRFFGKFQGPLGRPKRSQT